MSGSGDLLFDFLSLLFLLLLLLGGFLYDEVWKMSEMSEMSEIDSDVLRCTVLRSGLNAVMDEARSVTCSILQL